MARIDLKECDIFLLDGLSGTAAVDDMSISMGDTTLGVDTVALNTDVDDQIPVGARFTIAGESGTPVHTVTARSPSSGTTTSVTFTPALASGVMNDAVMTFLPQQLEIKVGDGDLTYSENYEYNYDLDRGELDTVRRGDEQPMEVNMNFTFEHITTGTGEPLSPTDAVRRRGAASEWVSSSADLCEPFAVDVKVVRTPECGTAQADVWVFPDFRVENIEPSFRDATIAISGRCNTEEPIVTRE